MLLYIYRKCSTCQKAVNFLQQNNTVFIQKEITETPPSLSELRTMLHFMHGNIKKLFNTSGNLYREMQLRDKLINTSENDALILLSQHGMLVKRPFLLAKNFGLIGFNEDEWFKKICT